MPIQVTEEKTTRSIIVRGKEKDLDVVDKVLREIDVRTKQVLMEVYIVEAESSFEQELGKKLGGAFTRQDISEQLVVQSVEHLLVRHPELTLLYQMTLQTLVMEKIH